MTQWIYVFGDERAAALDNAALYLGGKGAGLAQMTRLGLPVPPGFTITTELCRWFYAHERRFPPALSQALATALAAVERLTGRRFGKTAYPLLLSVRSGAPVSMPGQMDTVLNVGLNDRTVAALAAQAGAQFAYDSYRRFIHMYSVLVLGMDTDVFEAILDEVQAGREMEEMPAADWQEICRRYKARVEGELGEPFPQEPQTQLVAAVRAVLTSWMSARATLYRSLYNIPESAGTAVTVQAMVFGNMGQRSATGVAYTRNPATGENSVYGEFLPNAQGDDVVSGIRTPQQISEKARLAAGEQRPSLERAMPEAFAALRITAARLERHYRAVQDIEFTIEEGRLWLLQTRKAHCTSAASLKIAVAMVREHLIDRREVVLRVEAEGLRHLLAPVIDPAAQRVVIARGLPVSPGVATGRLVFSSLAAVEAQARGEAVILVRPETSPYDIHGMNAAAAIVTIHGGVGSHAAAIARGMGKPCVCGAGEIYIDKDENGMRVAGKFYEHGAPVSVDGNSGEILAGAVALRAPDLPADFTTFMQWVDELDEGENKTAKPDARLVHVQARLRENA
ncbi:MAG: Pyruvate, phosphate dikinase [Candidatus Tokpelaia hoelldobleri]|uniref:Pyruvate, phosphate dikinase n=1 Tax=Candidatus Tokpelaia hoelldobleri TaxID=1902579 RepID=A0A1U9JTA6_9HYPH|nr:MAG: Pyruvate, phosphate dikinase [Candidatus Tokpelaia hoelldoblerii]